MQRTLRPLVPFLLVAIGLAGCIIDDDEAGPFGESTELTPEPVYLFNKVVDPDSGIGEPSLGVHPDGTLFTNTDAGVFRSDDQGRNWTHLGDPMDLPNFDPDLNVDPDGVVYYNTLWIGCTEVAVSQDKGDTWAKSQACGAPASDRQYIIGTGDCVAYEYAHQLPSFQQTFAKTTDCGATWVPMGSSEVGEEADPSEGSGWGGGGFYNAATGSVFFTWSWAPREPSNEWSPGFTVTRDAGLTWSPGFLPRAEGDRLGLSLVVGAADDRGNVYLAWGEGHTSDVGIYVAYSRNDGVDWSDKIRVDVPGKMKVFPAIAAGSAGQVAVAYYESSYSRPLPGNSTDDQSWNVTLAWTENLLADEPVFRHGRMSSGLVKQGGICASGTGCAEDREFLDYFALERLPDGRLGTVFNSQHHLEPEEDDEEPPTRNVFAPTREAIFAPWPDA